MAREVCSVVSRADGLAAVSCPSAAARRDELQRYAESDARDPAVRLLALSLVRSAAVLRPDVVGPRLWAAVRARVRYVGEVAPDLWSHSLTTWGTGAGDCDDSARLLVALALSLGLSAHVVTIDRSDGTGHASVVLHDGSGWVWADPSVPGAAWGESPLVAFARVRSMWPGATGVGLAGLGGDARQDHAGIRSLLRAVLNGQAIPARPATLQAVQSIALLESSYGRGWSGPMAGSHNMGAIGVGAQPPCPPGSAPNGDKHPDGSGYVQCFKVYADDAAGLEGLVRFLWKSSVRKAAFEQGTSADDIGRSMIVSGYAEGTGRSCRAPAGASALERAAVLKSPACMAERVDGYASAVFRASKSIAAALHEPHALPRASSGLVTPPGGEGPSTGLLVAGGAALVAAGGLAWWLSRRGRG